MDDSDPIGGTRAETSSAGERLLASGDLSRLAIELRTAVTPVVNYLELLAADHGEALGAQHLQWLEAVEERVERIRALNDQVTDACTDLRRFAERPEGAPGPVASRSRVSSTRSPDPLR